MNNAEHTDLDPTETVRGFIADMHVWEVQTAADYNATEPRASEAFWDRARAAQAVVFAR